MNKKKLLALLMALVMTLSLVPVTALATEVSQLPETLPAIPVAESNKYVTQDELLGLAQELGLQDPSGLASVVAAMNFTMTTDEAEATTEFYKDWVADFALFFDKKIEANTITPIGQYGSYDVIPLPALPEMSKGTTFMIMKQGMHMSIPYSGVRDFVQDFYCGIAIDDITAIQENTKATLQLRLYMPTSLSDALTSAGLDLQSVATIYANDKDSMAILSKLKTDESGEYAGIPYFVITEDSFLLRPAVAQIGNDKYPTLADAIKAVPTDGTATTITMLADVDNAEGMAVEGGKNFTVDFDGHTYTVNKPGAGSTGTETNAFQLLQGSTITFKNGTIQIAEDNRNPADPPAANIKRIIQNYANLTLDNMTIDATNQYGGKDYPVSFNNGTSTINDTEIIGLDETNVAFDVCTWSSYKSTSVTITGDSNIGGVVEVATWNDPDTLSLHLESGTIEGIAMGDNADKAIVTKASDCNAAAPTGYYWNNGTLTAIPENAVAQIGDVTYDTLEEAVAEAQPGNTITLLSDIALTATVSITENLTIDLNGHDIASTNARALWVKSGNVTITGQGTVSATATGGSGFKDSSSVIRVGDSGAAAALTIDSDVTVSSDHCYGVSAFGTNTDGITLTVNGTVSVSGTQAAIATSGNGGQATPTITINSGAVVENTNTSGTTKSEKLGVYLPAGNLTVENGATISGQTAIYQKSGALTINGGTISGTGARAPYEYYNNGGYATGDAIVIDSCNYPNGAPTAYIKGATISSTNGKQIGYYVYNGSGEGKVYADEEYTLNTNVVKGWVENTGAYQADYPNTIGTVSAVAQIGTTEYPTLESAIDAAQDGDTIELLKNFTLSNHVTVPADKTVKLDYKGYTITSTLTGSYAPIENYGTLTVVDTSTDKTGGIAGVNRCINNYGTLNVGTGSFDEETKTTSDKVFGGNYSTTSHYGGTAIRNANANAVMNVYDCVVNAGMYAVYNYGTATIYGGTFNGDSCSICYSYSYTVSSEGTLTIYDATVSGVHGALSVAGGSGYVYGGSYSAIACANSHSNKTATAATYYALYVAGEYANVSAEIYGGSFSSEGVAVVQNGNSGDGGLKLNASLKIYGGTFEAKSSHTKVFNKDTALGDPLIAGGIFKAENSGKIEAFKTSAINNHYLDTNRTLKQINELTYEVTIKYEEQSTTDTTVTTEDGDKTTSTAFAVDNTTEIPTYAIKTQVTTTVAGETPTTDTTYKKVDVYTGTAAEVATNVDTTTATQPAITAAEDAISNYSTGSATFEATLFANDAASADNVLKTAAAANAIAKAAAQKTVNVNDIKEAKVILQTTLKAVGTSQDSGRPTVTYDITPVAQLYNEGGDELGKPVALNNEDIEEGQTFTFNIPVPANMEGNRIKVSHVGSNGYATEIGTYAPGTADAKGVRYITVTVDHFSEFELEETAVDITGSCRVSASLTLRDSIDINFYVKELVGDLSRYEVKYSFDGGDVTTVPYSTSTWAGDNTNGYKFVVASCAAAQMNDTVSFEVYYDGVQIKSVTYSIRQYCMNKIDANSNQNLIALCKAVLDYGAYAQKYFGYKTGTLANRGGYTYGAAAIGEIDVPENNPTIHKADGVTAISASLNLKSKTELNIYFTGSSYTGNATVSSDGQSNDKVTVTTTPIAGTDIVRVTVSGISAPYLADTFTVQLGDSTVTYSPMTYAYRYQNDTSRGMLVKALYNYYDLANTLFNNN